MSDQDKIASIVDSAVTYAAFDFKGAISQLAFDTLKRLAREYYGTFDDWVVFGDPLAPAHEAAAKAAGLPSLITGQVVK